MGLVLVCSVAAPAAMYGSGKPYVNNKEPQRGTCVLERARAPR